MCKECTNDLAFSLQNIERKKEYLVSFAFMLLILK